MKYFLITIIILSLTFISNEAKKVPHIGSWKLNYFYDKKSNKRPLNISVIMHIKKDNIYSMVWKSFNGWKVKNNIFTMKHVNNDDNRNFIIEKQTPSLLSLTLERYDKYKITFKKLKPGTKKSIIGTWITTATRIGKKKLFLHPSMTILKSGKLKLWAKGTWTKNKNNFIMRYSRATVHSTMHINNNILTLIFKNGRKNFYSRKVYSSDPAWTYKIGKREPRRYPKVFKNILLIEKERKKLVALDLKTGNEKMILNPEGYLGDFYISKNDLFITSTSEKNNYFTLGNVQYSTSPQYLYKVNASNLWLKWKKRISIIQHPAFSNTTIFYMTEPSMIKKYWYLYAIDREKGNFIFKHPVGYHGTSPYYHKKRVYYGTSNGILVALDDTYGSVLDEKKIYLPFIKIYKIVKNNMIALCGTYPSYNLYRINLKTWKYKIIAKDFNTMTHGETNKIYFSGRVTSKHDIISYDISKDKIIWKQQLPRRKHATSVHLAFNNGKLFVLMEKRNLFILNSNTGHRIDTLPSNDNITLPLIVNGNNYYYGIKNTYRAFKLKKIKD